MASLRGLTLFAATQSQGKLPRVWAQRVAWELALPLLSFAVVADGPPLSWVQRSDKNPNPDFFVWALHLLSSLHPFSANSHQRPRPFSTGSQGRLHSFLVKSRLNPHPFSAGSARDSHSFPGAGVLPSILVLTRLPGDRPGVGCQLWPAVASRTGCGPLNIPK